MTASSIIRSGGTSSQYLMADGSVSTLSNPVTGTGTTNTLPKFSGSTTIANSNIRDDGTDVVIASRTSVILSNQVIMLLPNVSGTVNRIETTGTLPLALITSGSSITLAAGGSTPQFTLTSGGNVLIGTTTDNGSRLSIAGGRTFINTGQSAASTAAYTAFNNLTFNDDFSDVARGPNKIITYGRGTTWVGGIGIHDDTQAYYAGGTHKWYQYNGTTATLNLSLDGSGNLATTGSIRTGTLDTGYVAGFWKLGRAVTGTQPSETHQIIVEINGQLYVIGAAAL